MVATARTHGAGLVDHYERIAQDYDAERFACRCGQIVNEVELRIVIGMVAPGSRVLDVGSGTGRFSLAAAKVACTVVGIDAAKNMISSAARNKAADAGAKDVEFVVGDGRRLPFRAASFDVVISVKLLSHCPYVDPLIAEMGRVLRPGGSLLLDSPHPLAGAYRRLGPRLAIQSYDDYLHPFAEIEEALRRNTIDVAKRVTYSILPRGIVHRLFCGHPRIVSAGSLQRILASQPGLLAFVEGSKRA